MKDEGITEGDIVKYSQKYLSYFPYNTELKGRRGVAGKQNIYLTKNVYREVLWEDTNSINEIMECNLTKV